LLIKAGQFIPLAPTTILGTNFSEAYKINDRGDIVGIFLDDNDLFHGFLLSKGVLTTLDFPGTSETFATGINESGTVVGFWDLLDADGNDLAEHGFTWKDGAFTEVNFPGSADTDVLGINARGDLVGGGTLAFLSRRNTGLFAPMGNASALMFPSQSPLVRKPTTSMRLVTLLAPTSTSTIWHTDFSLSGRTSPG
jgi:uncharacterized membrane protein